MISRFCQIFLAVFILSTGLAADANPRAWLKSSWKSFCEKYLVAEDPYENFESGIVESILQENLDHAQYIERLINFYREMGGKRYFYAIKFGSGRITPTEWMDSFWCGLYMTEVGRELSNELLHMRHLLTDEQELAIRDAFLDYGVYQGRFIVLKDPKTGLLRQVPYDSMP